MTTDYERARLRLYALAALYGVILGAVVMAAALDLRRQLEQLHTLRQEQPDQPDQQDQQPAEAPGTGDPVTSMDATPPAGDSVTDDTPGA